jgi:GT2 family glycosyltransferase
MEMGERVRQDAQLTVIDTGALEAPTPSGGLLGNRAAAYALYGSAGAPKCTVAVMGYNRLEKTKYCVACVLAYTRDVDHELILIDNGSDDGTLEFFLSVEHPAKRVVRVTKNIGSSFPHRHLLGMYRGKYLVTVSNDVYVTKNWLSNLLACYESDPAVGYVQPVSSNVSNFQQIDLPYANFEEMQERAAAFNVSDPLRWNERVRLIGILGLFSREVLEAVGSVDPAFVHDFGEDDLSLRIRRAGYRLVLCCDTWVCHDHDFGGMGAEDQARYALSLQSGREIFAEKHRGLDAWDDTVNFEFGLLDPLHTADLPPGNIRLLAVDPRCGTPLLEMRNHLRKRGRLDVESRAFTTQVKYYADLQAAAQTAVCDRIEYLAERCEPGAWHIVALCEPLDGYEKPLERLEALFSLLAPGGLLLFKLRSAQGFRAVLRLLGRGGQYEAVFPVPPETVSERLRALGASSATVKGEAAAFTQQEERDLAFLVEKLELNQDRPLLERLRTETYLYCAVR